MGQGNHFFLLLCLSNVVCLFGWLFGCLFVCLFVASFLVASFCMLVMVAALKSGTG